MRNETEIVKSGCIKRVWFLVFVDRFCKIWMWISLGEGGAGLWQWAVNIGNGVVTCYECRVSGHIRILLQ